MLLVALLVDECTVSAVTGLTLALPYSTVHCMVTTVTTAATTDITCAATLLSLLLLLLLLLQTDLRALSQMKDEEDLIRDERNSRRPKQQSSRKGEVSVNIYTSNVRLLVSCIMYIVIVLHSKLEYLQRHLYDMTFSLE
jgi:hypothetical protein